MRSTKVKGFTLIELIIVMGTFSVIMFGAFQLMGPVNKIMVQSDVNEGGNAAVSSIANYLENEISPAEYLVVSNEVVADKGVAYVDDFVKTYYEGVLYEGATTTAPIYGTGKVHVLTIDNRPGANGKISKYIYNVDFTLGRTVTAADRDTSLDQEYAINKAYYDDYSFTIRSGLYDADAFDYDPSDPTATPPEPDTYEDLVNNLSTNETVFTIAASTERNGNPYTFVSNATMSLVNIYNRGGLGVTGVYYVVNQKFNYTPSTGAEEYTKEIVDITTPNLSTNGSYWWPSEASKTKAYTYTESRTKAGVSKGSYVKYIEGCTDGYTLVYSYGSEMNKTAAP